MIISKVNESKKRKNFDTNPNVDMKIRSKKSAINPKSHNFRTNFLKNINNEIKSLPKFDFSHLNPTRSISLTKGETNRIIPGLRLNTSRSVDKIKLMSDYNKCEGDISKLKQTLKNQKSQDLDIHAKIDQIKSYITTAQSYINNLSKTYSEKYRRSSDNFDCRRNLSLISQYQGEKSPRMSISPEAKSRASMPILSYSMEDKQLNSNICSTSLSEPHLDIVRPENQVVEINNFELMSCDDEEGYYKNKANEDFKELDQSQIDQIEIINNKLNENNLSVENFSIQLDYTQNKTFLEKQGLLQEQREREMMLAQKLLMLKNELMRKENDNQSLNQSIKELMLELEKGEQHRRKLHNYIQELRGNIRVYCRVKPSLDSMESLSTCVKYPELTTANNCPIYSVEILGSNMSSSLNASNTFHFDRVFPEFSQQAEIFQEIKPFIQSALDGENVCIFAYGATGTGKTYTMQGPSYNKDYTINEFSGILPRAAESIFSEILRLNKQNIQYRVYLSAIEIYNENIYDLFDSSLNKQPLQLFAAKNSVLIKNLIYYEIKTKEDILRLTKEASETRRIDSTMFNDTSSRSHAVYTIKIEANNNGKITESAINIIDLAGSERCMLTSVSNKTKDEVEMMKKQQNEANFINKSLTTLGRIISMLADKKSNKMAIPYRESKLTLILQNSLKVTSKTAMIVTISPENSHYHQSKESLKFAANSMIAF